MFYSETQQAAAAEAGDENIHCDAHTAEARRRAESPALPNKAEGAFCRVASAVGLN